MTRIRFEDLPSTNTPRNAENLNKLNNVVINPTEPTTGEEVWIQKGKNLFNPNTDIEFTDGYRDWYGKGKKIDDDSKFGLKIQVEPNKTYVTNSDIPYEEYHNLCFFNGEMLFISSDAYNTNDKTFTTPENCTYVTIALPKTYTWFELEEGSSITPKKIYTKNDNGVYEKFYDETDLEMYSTGERRIGTYLGKPLYRNVITGNIADNTTLVSNVKVLLDAKGSGDINSIYRTLPYYEVWENKVYALMVNKNLSNEVKTVVFKAGKTTTAKNCNIVLEYTKTTD